ncbi:hypothetical protein GW915_05805 [bacterium]|nr:hypothetical protein [bacterium]
MQNPDKTPVAADLYTLCTREKIETWHVVRNHNAQGIVDRVICKSCGSEHKYRPTKKIVASSSTRSSVIRRSPATEKNAAFSPALRDTWFSQIKAWGVDKEAIVYDPKSSFEEGQVIKHQSFGKGAIQKIRGTKMDVLFEEGIKTLPTKKKVLEF